MRHATPMLLLAAVLVLWATTEAARADDPCNCTCPPDGFLLVPVGADPTEAAQRAQEALQRAQEALEVE